MAGQGALSLAQYSIGEVEQLTGIKAHILRYWEEVIPSISPQKDGSGHRAYTLRDLEIIRRLKYLIYTKGYTIEGARRQLIEESDVPDTKIDMLITIKKCRAELNDAFLHLRKYCAIARTLRTGKTGEPADEQK